MCLSTLPLPFLSENTGRSLFGPRPSHACHFLSSIMTVVSSCSATALSYYVYTDEGQGLPVLWCLAGFLIGFFVNVSAMEIVSASVSTFFVCFAEVHATNPFWCTGVRASHVLDWRVASLSYVTQDPSALQSHQPTLCHMTHEVWRRLHGDLHIGPGT